MEQKFSNNSIDLQMLREFCEREGYGNDWHPNVWQDEKMGNELAPFLRELMNWY